MRSIRIAVCGLLIFVLGSAARADDTLRWRWGQGQRLQVGFEQTIETVTTVNKRPIRMDIQIRMEMHWRVIDVDSDGGAVVEQTIDRLRMSLKTPERPPIEYDSRTPAATTEARSISETVGPMVGEPFRVDVAATGEIRDVRWAKQPQDAPADGPKKPPASSLLTKEGVSKMLRQAVPPFPDQEVAEGGKWNREHTLESAFGKLRQVTEFHRGKPIQREGREVIAIDVVGRLSVEAPAAEARGKLVSQKLTGTLWYDSAAGRLQGSQVRQELGSERPYRGTTISVNTITSLNMSIREVVAVESDEESR